MVVVGEMAAFECKLLKDMNVHVIRYVKYASDSFGTLTGHVDMAVGMSEQAVFLDLDDIGLYSPRANSLTIYVSVASFVII